MLDEPLAALDRKLRERAVELASLRDRVGTTFVVVTHDQEEAMAIATHRFMHAGRIAQVGTQGRSTSTRRNRYVAGFVGNINLIEGRVSGS